MLGILLLVGLPVITDADLSLQLSALKSSVLVGEPTKLVLTWTAKRPAPIVPGTDRLLLDSGAGFREYVEARFFEETSVAPSGILEPGILRLTAYEVGVEQTDSDSPGPRARFAMPTPGTYRVKVMYDEASSNEVSITVLSPRDQDAELYSRYLAAHPELLTLWIAMDDSARASASSLLNQYGSSPYLARPALIVLKQQFDEAATADIDAGRDPWEGDALRVFERLQALDLSGTAFGEDHLLLIAQLSERLFDLDRRREFYEAVIERYPNGVAAVRAKEWLDENLSDRAAPVLDVTAAPSSLWPPNHKLEPITVVVQVSDARDPNPLVKLLSITCDDACDPASDISGAAYGTDDRQFELRSERKGTSKDGRTYTITYAAEDASGNKTTAMTTVAIAHDQGKK